jgi:hypothetical protein
MNNIGKTIVMYFGHNLGITNKRFILLTSTKFVNKYQQITLKESQASMEILFWKKKNLSIAHYYWINNKY